MIDLWKKRRALVLRQVLSKAQEEYAALTSWDLLRANDDERQLYFARYSLLKQLISSIESYLDENRRLELQLLKTPREDR